LSSSFYYCLKTTISEKYFVKIPEFNINTHLRKCKVDSLWFIDLSIYLLSSTKYYMQYNNLVLSACLICSLKLKVIIIFWVFIFKLFFRVINKYAFFILKFSLSTLLPSLSSLLRLLPFPLPLPSCNPLPP